MIMNLIGIDEERIDRDGYVVQSMWDIIDEAFSEINCKKEELIDGTVLYKGNINSNNLWAEFFYPYAVLTDNPDFAKYCNKWIEYTNEYDESKPFAYEDYLAGEREDNPLFNKVNMQYIKELNDKIIDSLKIEDIKKDINARLNKFKGHIKDEELQSLKRSKLKGKIKKLEEFANLYSNNRKLCLGLLKTSVIFEDIYLKKFERAENNQ